MCGYVVMLRSHHLKLVKHYRKKLFATEGSVRPPVCVCSFNDHGKMATSCLKKVKVCSYEARVCVCVCVCVCVNIPNLLASHPRRA
jgi:hypothetical protein